MIAVEVAYADPDRQIILAIQVEAGCTVHRAICRSGILEQFPQIDLSKNKVGVFSQVSSLSQALREGDRVEIYRDLVNDPKEARRQRARKER